MYSFGFPDAKSGVKGFGTFMRDETVERILAALNEVYKPLGVDRFEEAIRIAREGLLELEKRLAKLQDTDAVRQKLRDAPEPDPAVLEEVLKGLPQAVYTLRELGKVAIKQIPHDPGGRPIQEARQRQQEICEDIAALMVKRVPLTVAYRRVGQKYGASARTIQRIWNERKGE